VGEHLSPEEQITIDFTLHGEISVVCVAGEVDLSTCESIRETLRTLVDHRPPALVLDLTAIDFFGSSGVAILVDMIEQTARTGVAFAVAADGACVLRPLRVTNVDSFVGVYPDAASALRAVESAPPPAVQHVG
jgi:anti-sigma B factor antagonist